MTARSLQPVGAVLLAAGCAVLAAPVAARGQEREIPVLPHRQVEPEDVRRAADWLQALQGNGPAGIDSNLLKQIEQLRKQNPNASNEDLARRLKEQNPQLQDPAQQERLRQWLQQFGGPNQPGGGPPLPNVPGPGGLPPGFPGQPLPPPPGDRPGQFPMPPPFEERPRPRPRGDHPGPEERTPRPDHFPGDARLPDGQPWAPLQQPGQAFDPEVLARRQREYQAAAGFWERNFGPLNETPAVRNVLLEMLAGQDVSADSPLSGVFDGAAESGEGLFQTADASLPSGWKLPELGFGKWNFDGPSAPSMPNGPGPSGGPSISGVSGPASWLPVILLGVVAAVGLVLWWLWPMLTGKQDDTPRPLPGLGPWPVDPRSIADREGLVKAFEYLSVLVCGGDARVWNHLTIAAELRQAVPEADGIADPLARLYALARYTPAAEPLPPGAIGDARHYLCRLAGVAP